MFARAASSPMSSAGRAWLTPLPHVTARRRFRPPARIIFQFEEKWGMAEARISVGPGLLCSIKPSWSWKVSWCNEPRPCRRCANIPQDAACILIADCERVFARVCSVCAHDRASSPCSCEEQGNRVTLWLIRKLMHRKSRQRRGSPSARSAGENNLHIGRLMDTFIGSTEREGWWGGGSKT